VYQAQVLLPSKAGQDAGLGGEDLDEAPGNGAQVAFS
jgi:hypothetical protein